MSAPTLLASLPIEGELGSTRMRSSLPESLNGQAASVGLPWL